jgi:hypothetical protein
VAVDMSRPMPSVALEASFGPFGRMRSGTVAAVAIMARARAHRRRKASEQKRPDHQ